MYASRVCNIAYLYMSIIYKYPRMDRCLGDVVSIYLQ